MLTVWGRYGRASGEFSKSIQKLVFDTILAAMRCGTVIFELLRTLYFALCVASGKRHRCAVSLTYKFHFLLHASAAV